MTNLKTKEEMYFDYNEAIEELENEVNSLESLIGRTEFEIKHKKDRIEKLKETAEIYAPKKTITQNFSINLNDLSSQVVKDFNDAMKQIDMKSVREQLKRGK